MSYRSNSKKSSSTRTIKRKAKNLNIEPNCEEITDNNKRKTTIIERIYSDKTIDKEPEPEPEPPKGMYIQIKDRTSEESEKNNPFSFTI